MKAANHTSSMWEMLELWQPVKVLTRSQECESRCQTSDIYSLVRRSWSETANCILHLGVMTPSWRCEGSHFKVLTLEFEKRLDTMGPLLDIKVNLTIHQQGVSKTVTIDGYNGVPLWALAHVTHGWGYSLTCHWVWAWQCDLQHWRIQ